MEKANGVKMLREKMNGENINLYLIASSDYHQSEYVGDYFKARAYVSKFTGSAGTVVVGKEKAGLWTDGRYFIQGESQLSGTGIDLYKMGEEGVPTVNQFIEATIEKGGTLAFDGRTISAKMGEELEHIAVKSGGMIESEIDLVDKIWENRPEISTNKAFILEEKYTGQSTSSKLQTLRQKMEELGAKHHIITTLDDEAWLLNIRGNDAPYSPLILCYMIVHMDSVELFIDENKLNSEIMNKFEKDNIQVKPYNDIFAAVKNISGSVLLDKNKVSYAIVKELSECVEIVQEKNPTTLLKALKNETELKNIKEAHIKDGVAITKFMYWLKNNVGKETITEISAANKLEEFRKEQSEYLGESFSPICGYKEHAAMMHYSASEESSYELKPEHLFLNDTGGNYIQGATDITRTFVLGEISEELKTHFTAVVRGVINLSKAKFLQGVKGHNLDVLARMPMWELGIDYKCGTGHGVGYLLTIHEGPQSFRWQESADKGEAVVLQEGMILTNEPGIYIEGSHGIRIENELIVQKAQKNKFGQFMELEVITFAPIDLDGINKELMSKSELAYLNDYHGQVYEKISPYLTEEEKVWLKNYTRKI